MAPRRQLCVISVEIITIDCIYEVNFTEMPSVSANERLQKNISN